MKISELGGEFELIKRISRKYNDKSIITGIGDDTAVIKIGKKFILLTTDMLVEDDHFSLKYFKPENIGIKAIESNVSDIAAMGGIPKYALVSLSLPPNTTVEFVDRLYKGIYKISDKYGIAVIGGDTTHGSKIVISITLTGEAKKLCLRSDARPGDFIMVSGDLGKSTAGLELLRKNLKGKSTESHLNPQSRLKESKVIAKYANAMQDVSDGLASEVAHICEASKVGAIIFKDNIPISDSTLHTAKRFGKDAVDWALFGGEDFELVFTVPPKYLGKVKGYLVGEITKKKGLQIYTNGRLRKLSKKGFDHFI